MPSAVILPASLAIPRSSNRSLSSCGVFTGTGLFQSLSIAATSFTTAGDYASLANIRMGGGPRTYPGGVSKWQWKRMQAKKSKQLLKARLCRERQLYEMRKRAELKAAISELERPWEVVERAPVLFSTSADEQIKALSDRFQRPNGFDMWSARDGPQLFRSPDDLPSVRLFPKGAVHTLKPHGVVTGELAAGGEEGEKMMRHDDWIVKGVGGKERRRRARVLPDSNSLESEQSVPVEGGNRGSYNSDLGLVVAGSRKVRDGMEGHFGRHGGNHGSHASDSVLSVDGSKMNGDHTADDFGRRGSRGSRDPNLSSPGSLELENAGSKMERHELAGRINRRGVGGGRSRYRYTYGSQSDMAFNGLSMERHEMASDFSRGDGGDRNQGYHESHSELAFAGSRMQRREMAGRFDRLLGDGGRGRNRGSYRSYSDTEKEKGGFVKRDGRVGNRNDIDCDRRGGRGGRGGNRGSHRSYSDTEKEKGGFGKRDGRVGNRNDIDFDRRGGGGGRGGNRGSYRPYSELPVAASKMERDEFAGGFRKSGNRSGNRNSYFSDSELVIAGSRKGSFEMSGRRDREHSYRGRALLRPTTEVRLEEGGNARRESKWREGRNDGFGVRSGRRSP